MIQKEHKKLARFKKELKAIKLKCFWIGVGMIVLALSSDFIAMSTQQQYNPGPGMWELFICFFGGGMIWLGWGKK